MSKLGRILISAASASAIFFSPGCLQSPKVPPPVVEKPAEVSPQPDAVVVSSEAEAAQLEAKLKETPPPRDLFSLSRRLKGKSEQRDERSVAPERPDYDVGSLHTFWLADQQKKNYYRISATLRHKTPHAYFYVENGQEVSLEGLRQAGDVFEDRIYPTVRDYFGNLPDLGLDDPRITILHASFPGPPGYYSSADEFPSYINPYSNEREMIYINLRNTTPGAERYYSTITHELQHMVHSRLDSSEDTWINEGLSELAVRLAGYATTGSEVSFAVNPDTQLNSWAEDPSRALPHYGAAYLLVSYLAERYGGYEGLKDLVAEKARGINGVERYLDKKGFAVTFDDVFKDWVIANYLDDPQLDDGRYGYKDIDVHVRASDVGELPVRVATTVHQYAADYLDLGQVRGDYAIAFTGTATVKLLANDAHSGRRQWWGNRGDGVDTTLTREFDLAGLDGATLSFSAWYDIEKGYDYAYVEISTDGGATWTTLRGLYTTDSDPNGNNLGNGYTGRSGGAERPDWIDERIDLTPYVGGKALIRFECVTDDAYAGPGFAVDDISIPELGYSYDGESEGRWIPDGFVLFANSVPQRYFVQIIRLGPQPRIDAMPLDGDRRGQLIVSGDGSSRVVLVVAGAAAATSELASYEYSVEQLSVERRN